MVVVAVGIAVDAVVDAVVALLLFGLKCLEVDPVGWSHMGLHCHSTLLVLNQLSECKAGMHKTRQCSG